MKEIHSNKCQNRGGEGRKLEKSRGEVKRRGVRRARREGEEGKSGRSEEVTQERSYDDSRPCNL
jgi:hypothetical protein